jgi:hypothetical protein
MGQIKDFHPSEDWGPPRGQQMRTGLGLTGAEIIVV